MKLRKLLTGVPIQSSTADPETEITGVSYDSRTTKPGDLFVAVSGMESDGHRYIPMAQEKESMLSLFVGGKKYFINPLILVMSIHIGINTALHDFHNLVIESRVKNQ